MSQSLATGMNGREAAANCSFTRNAPAFPFKSVLSLAPIIRLWQQYAEGEDPLRATFAAEILKQVQNVPELHGPIMDLGIIEQHRPLVRQLLSPIFPDALWEETCAAAVVPFQLQPILATPKFAQLKMMKNGGFSSGLNLEESHMRIGKTLNAYSQILKRFYGVDARFEYPLVFTCQDPVTNLPRHHKISIDLRFIEIRKIRETRPLAAEEISKLLANPTNLDVWFQHIPPECFEFHGFVVFTAVDVTDQEVLSSLKNDLLEKDSIISMSRFSNLEHKLRALLQRPDLKLGLAGIPGAQSLLHEHGKKIGKSFILSDRCRHGCSSFDGSLYDTALQKGEMVIVEDLTAYPNPTKVEQEIIREGIKNIFVAPLYYEKELVGVLEIGSPNAGDLHAINALKLKEVVSLFAIAIKRSMDEMNDRVEAVIKDQCTAIHPSVEWRFRRAALKYLRNQREGVMAEMDPIVFEDVYPLYGLSDIRGSSTLRNEAIRIDLVDQLNMAAEVVVEARRHKPLPYLSELEYQIHKHLTRIESGLGSGDEISTLEFLRWKVVPNFDHLQGIHPAVLEKVEAYRASLDPHLGILYRRRRDFDESVMLINETIAKYIDAEQEKAQAMFPHYFEKYKSDGVDHGIYIGKSLVEDGKFDMLYLRNIRLWQMMFLCGVAQQAESLKPKLKIPLETAHLLLVQNTPLAVRFRYDEKKFDVDGAYNVRYEIMKKRIDKALIKGTRERLTQPGKIAIVYSQPKEAIEYLEYIDYLRASGYLVGEHESFDLEDLQGMSGLKALRVSVNLNLPRREESLPRNGEAVLEEAIAEY